MISRGMVSPRKCRTAASVATALIAMASKLTVASIFPAAMPPTASGTALPGGRARHEVEQRNARGVETEEGVVDRGLVHGDEDRRVGSLRDRARDQRDLLAHIVRLLGDIVDRAGAEPGRDPVGAHAGRL